MEMKAIALPLACLAGGIALGLSLPRSDARGDGVPPAEAVRDASPRPRRDDSRVRALRARIAELEKELAAKGDSEPPPRDAAQAEQPPAPAERPSPREGFRAMLERMKRENPARYAQMTNQGARMLERMRTASAARMDILGDIDTSGMSAEARKTHDDYVDALARRDEAVEKMRQEDLSDEERREIGRQLWETNGRVRELRQAERANLLAHMAEKLGYKGDEAGEVTATINSIIQATDPDMNMFRPPRPPR